MRKIGLENGILTLKTDGADIALKFNIYVLKEAERKSGSLFKILEYINTFEGARTTAALIINEAIKRYNREYNLREKPISQKEIIDLMDTPERPSELKTAVKVLYMLSQPKHKDRQGGSGRSIEPSVAGFVISAVSSIGFSVGDVMDMTLRELAEYIDVYCELNSMEREYTYEQRANIKGIGSAKDLKKLLRGK